MGTHVLSKWLAFGGVLNASAVVLHATAGSTLEGAVSALRTAKLSYHYIIDKNGSVYKCIPLGNIAYHAGSSYGPREEAHGVSRAQYPNNALNRTLGRVHKFVAGCSVNGYSVGISFVNRNDGEDPITQAQWDAALALITAIQTQHRDIRHVTTHAIVSPKRKSDPQLFDLDAFAKAARLKAWRPS